MAQDVQGMLIRIEATSAQLRQELARAEKAVGASASKIDKELINVDRAVDRAMEAISASVAKAHAGLDQLGDNLSSTAVAAKSMTSAVSSAGNASAGAARGFKATAGAVNAAGLSAAQYSQAMRMLPMQLTDVVTSLASGMPVWMVAIQQGGQVRDSFGGIGAAARAAISAINPLTAAIGVAAASIGTLVYAYQGGQGEALAFNRALTLTGNAAGTSVDVLMETASALDQVSGTQRQAAAALAEIVATGKIASDQFANVAAAAMAMEQATGKAVADTVKEFAALADEPAAASAKLNQQYNYLTASVYKQIAALEQQGDKIGAAKLAMEEYGNAAKERSDDIEQSLGYIDRALNGLKAGWREMWDAAFDIGRPETLEEKLAGVEQAISRRKNNIYVGSVFDWGPSAEELERQRQGIQLSIQQRDLDAAFISLRAQNAQQEIKAAEEERKATEQLDKSYDSMLASLRQTTALHGQASEVARVRYATEHGELSKLTGAQKTALLVAAQEADAKEAAAEAGRKSAASLREQKSALDALIAKYDPAAKAQAEYEKGIELADKALRDGTYTTEQYQKVVQGLYTDLNKPIWDKHNKAVDEAKAKLKALDDQLDAVRDRLEPARVATRRLADEKKLLKEALDKNRLSFEEYQLRLQQLEKEYDDNTRATSEWAKWTEGALDRVDSAFADAWRNIGDGFSSFRDSLTNAFKQMLAELAHMAITKPIIMQIGAAMGIGGGAGQAVSMMGGGSAGGINYGQLASYGQSAYSALTGWGQAAYTGWQNGGVTGAYNGVTGYYGDMFSGAYNAVSGALGYGNGANIAGYTGQAYANWAAGGSQAIGASQAGYTGAQYSAWVGQQNAAAAASTYAPWASAAAGAYMGYQNSGAKGAVAGGLGGWGGAKAGASMGSYFGPIGTAVGAVIGGILGSTLGSKVFGGDWETKSAGLALGVEGGDFLGQSYKYQKKDGGLFGSTKRRYKYSALDEETAAQFQSAFDATENTVASVFEQLSLTVEEGSLAGLQLAREKISTSGKTEEEISQAIAEWFGKAANSMTAELNKVFATGLDLDLEGMQAFVGNLQGVNEVLRYLDVGMYDASVAGGKLAEALSAAAGGLDALAANSATYYGAFFSDAEKVEDTIDSIKRTFESADVELASSRQAYREMVEDIDLTTEAGREMFATMMALSGQAAQYYSIVEQQAAAAAAQALANTQLYYDQFTTAAQKTEDVLAGIVAQFEDLELTLPGTRDGFIAAVDALDTTTEAGKKMFDTLMGVAGAADAYYDILEARAASVSAGTANAAVAASRGALSTLSAAINAEKSSIASAYQAQADSIRSAIGSANDSLSQMRSVASSLRSAVNGLRLESEQYAAQSRRSAQQAIRQALSGGGRVQMTDPLERALGTVSQSSEDLFGSFEDYARDYWQTYFAIEQLAERAEDQLSADELAVKALERQLDQSQRFHEAEIERLDGVLEGANAQLEALLGIDTSVQSVETALAAFTAALAAAQQLQNANSSITSVTGLAGVKRQVTSEGYLLDEKGALMELFGEAMRVVGNKVVGGAGATLNIGADGQLSWATGDYERWAKQEGIPGFASGGSHRGGLRLVGENGPELEVTGPSRIYNASQTAAMLGGGSETASEVRALRSDFAGMMDALRSVAKHTMQTAKRVEFLERWDFDGLPKERATA